MPRLPIRTLCTLSLLAACASESRPVGVRATAALEPVVTDSAGVTLLVHPAGAIAEAPAITIDSTPIAVVHGSAEDPDADISTIVLKRFDRNGRIYGYDRQKMEVVIFDADGSGRINVGRKGSGPGEFKFITAFLPTDGDSMLVADPSNGRVTVLHHDGSLGEEHSLASAAGAGGGNPIGLAGDKLLGTALYSSSSGSPAIKGVVLDLATDDAKLVFPTGPIEEEEPRIMKTPGGAVMAIRAMSTRPMEGYPQAFGWQHEFVVVDGNNFNLVMHDTTGKVTRVLRSERPRTVVTDAIWKGWVDQQIALAGKAVTSNGTVTFSSGGRGSGGGPDTAAMRRGLMGSDHVDSLPAYRSMAVSPNGNLWVLDYQAPGRDGWAATAFDTAGRIIGRLTVATGEPPVLFGDDRLLFRSEDDLGIATFTVLPFRPPVGRAR